MRTPAFLSLALLHGVAAGCSHSAPASTTPAARAPETAQAWPRSAAPITPAAPSWANDDVRRVDEALALHRARFDACLRTGAATPAGATDVVLDVLVRPSGRVKAVRVSSPTPANSRIGRCLASRMRTVSVAHEATTELHVLVPFRYGPEGLRLLPAERPPSASASAAPSHQPELVRSTMAERRPAVQRCYERVLRTRPEVRGTVTVEFTIHEGGRVGRVAIAENTTRHSGLASCIRQVVGRFRFSPAPVGGSVTYRYPYQFRPVG